MKKENARFKSLVFCCSVQNDKNEVIKFYHTSKNRYEVYENVCKLYPIKAGYCKRFVLSEV